MKMAIWHITTHFVEEGHIIFVSDTVTVVRNDSELSKLSLLCLPLKPLREG